MCRVTQRTAHRGRIVHCLADPSQVEVRSAVQSFDDGILLLEEGYVAAVAPTDALARQLGPDVEIINHGDKIIVPGFIDCHVHYPQLDVIASFGEQLLDWLESYTFPAEMRFEDPAHATATANFFLDELVKNGTTSALVFATVHAHSVDAIFAAAQKRHMRIAAGKVLMDQNCPPALQDSAESGYRDSRQLLEKWHQSDRLSYAITPRFAPTSSAQQLAAAGKLAAQFPTALIHTHLAENTQEVDWVAQLYPDARSYLDVYKQVGLLRDRAVFAHCIHLDETDHRELATAHGGIAFCPSSNLFLGSGLFDLIKAQQAGISVGLGTDVGAGTSLSLLQTMSAAYQVCQLNQQKITSFSALYLATLGAAHTLGMQDKVGNFAPGKEADFVVLDGSPTKLMQRRIRQTDTLAQELFVQLILGDDRSIQATYIMGQLAYAKDPGLML